MSDRMTDVSQTLREQIAGLAEEILREATFYQNEVPLHSSRMMEKWAAELDAAADRLASLEQQIQEKEKTLGSCSTTEVPEAADGGVKEHSAPSNQSATETTCVHCGCPIRLIDGRWEDAETHSTCDRDQSEDATVVNAITAVVREADEDFQRVGGTSRHWVRDCFLPALNAAGFVVESEKSVPHASVAVLSTQQPPQDSKESSLLAQVASLEQAQQALRAQIQQVMVRWRTKADRMDADAEDMQRDAGVGVVHPAAWEASRLRDCAEELGNLLTENQRTQDTSPRKRESL